MKNILSNVILFSLLCLPIFAAVTPGQPSDLPFKVVTHRFAKLSPKKQYIIGCDVTTVEISVGLFELTNRSLKLVLELVAPTKTVESFTHFMVEVMNYLAAQHGLKITEACFASPGATAANKDYIKHDHIAFAISGKELKAATSLQDILIVNDFEVVGLGIEAMGKGCIQTIHAGTPREHGTQMIVGAGQGLGSGLMLWDNALSSYTPSPLSYSYADFCAQTSLEVMLADFLQSSTGSKSWGKVLGASGGVLKIYDFLNLHNEYETAPVKYAHFQEVFTNRHADKRCADAVEMYMKLTARLIRTAAYVQMPFGGIFITNSVAQNNPELFKDAAFIREVMNTENQFLTDYLKHIPIYLVTAPERTLHMYGAAQYSVAFVPSEAKK